MNKLERYNITIEDTGRYLGDLRHTVCENGQWVRFTDIQKILEENERLRKDLSDLQLVFGEGIREVLNNE